MMAVQANRKETSGPYEYARYAWAPPLSGIADPNSAKLPAPVHANKPDTIHTAKLAPTLLALATTTPGDELNISESASITISSLARSHNMPDPI